MTDKEILKLAATTIRRELEAGREVKVPGFGKFYLSRVKWTDNDAGTFGEVNTVRFRPFGGLKEAVGNRTTDGTLGETYLAFEPRALESAPEKTVAPAPIINIHS